MVDLHECFGASADAIVAIDGDQRVVGWNEGAVALFGHPPEKVLGRHCNEVLTWHDRCGDAICRAGCGSPGRAEAGEVIESREVLGRSASGRRLWLSVTTVLPPPSVADSVSLFHLIREVSLPPELERLIAERLGLNNGHGNGNGNGTDEDGDCEAAAALALLTPREHELLVLLADGLGTAEIARQCVISPATVRNHVQKILSKLDVHSRVEAVALLLRHGS